MIKKKDYHLFWLHSISTSLKMPYGGIERCEVHKDRIIIESKNVSIDLKAVQKAEIIPRGAGTARISAIELTMKDDPLSYYLVPADPLKPNQLFNTNASEAVNLAEVINCNIQNIESTIERNPYERVKYTLPLSKLKEIDKNPLFEMHPEEFFKKYLEAIYKKNMRLTMLFFLILITFAVIGFILES